MDNLNIEEIKQLAVFYKQRSNELELTGLQNQLMVNRLTGECNSLKSTITNLENKIKILEKEKSEIENKYNSLTELNNKKNKTKKNQ